MKKNLLLILFCSFVFSGLSAQNLQTGSSSWSLNSAGGYDLTHKQTTRFNNQNDPIESIHQFRHIEFSGLVNSYRTTYEYDSDNRLKIRRTYGYNYTDNIIEEYEEHTSEYFYREGECIEKIIFTDTSQGSLSPIIYFHNPNTCLVDSVDYYYNNGEGDLRNQVRHYTYQDSLVSLSTREVNEQNEEEMETSRYEFIKNEQGLNLSTLILFFKLNEFGLPQISSGHSISRTYDEHDNITSNITYQIQEDSSLFLAGEYTAIYTYDENNNLLESTSNGTSYGFPQMPITTPTSSRVIYDYYCDNLLDRRTLVGSSSYTTYQYQKGHVCEPLEQEDLVTIRPSLTYGLVLIESEILLSPHSQIVVYDMSGKRIQYVPFEGRSRNYQLDLRDLPTGHYILHIFDDKHSETERVLKL